MIDWHSHILPAMDDGSRDPAESLQLLRMLSLQGADTVIATPHFYANDESVDEFLQRRKTAFDALSPHLPKEAPKILLGAEVKYYPGIARMTGLSELCIEGSRLLLLEMSMSRWTEYTLRELETLSDTGGVQVLLAHIDRYISLQHGDVWDRLLDRGILMQANANFFTDFGTRRRALSLLRRGVVRFIGSDCHGVRFRPPHIGDAARLIEKKLGKDFFCDLCEYGHSMLANQ